jgi:hypothetical protein
MENQQGEYAPLNKADRTYLSEHANRSIKVQHGVRVQGSLGAPSQPPRFGADKEILNTFLDSLDQCEKHIPNVYQT